MKALNLLTSVQAFGVGAQTVQLANYCFTPYSTIAHFTVFSAESSSFLDSCINSVMRENIECT